MSNDEMNEASRAKKPLDQGAVEIGYSDVVQVGPPEFYAAAAKNSAELENLTTKAVC